MYGKKIIELFVQEERKKCAKKENKYFPKGRI